ncbi:glycosyltransferase [Chloroflexota bacterium]
MLEGEDIICIAPNTWGGIWKRRQQLMSRFAQSNRVLYVEPARFILFTLLSRNGLAKLLQGRFYFRQERNNLFILSQYLVLPFERTFLRKRIKLIKRLNDWFCGRVLTSKLKRLNFNRPVLWVYYTPRSEGFIGKCRERIVVCDVFDRYSAYPYYDSDPWLKQLVDWQDASLIAKADVVFACSAPLHSYCKEFNPKVYLVPNGTDTVSRGKVSAAPKDTLNIQHPVLGYVGAIFDKLDFKLLSYLAEENPGWSILMIGPSSASSREDKERLSALKGKSNVFFLGPKPREELPDYYSVIDVALMPYKLTEHTRHIFPLKMFEYMAFRKPIVSTDIPAAREFSDVVSVAHDKEQFIDSISRLISEDTSQRVQRGFEIAQEHSWDTRVEKISQVIHARLYREAI